MITALTKDGKIIKQKKPVNCPANYVFSTSVPSPARKQEYMIPYSYKELLTNALTNDPETLNDLNISEVIVNLDIGITNIENAMQRLGYLEKVKKNPSFLDPSLKNARHALMNLKKVLVSRQTRTNNVKLKVTVE